MNNEVAVTTRDETNSRTVVERLVASIAGEVRAGEILDTLEIAPQLPSAGDGASRAELAMALNAWLFADLLDRVPTAARLVSEVRSSGRRIVFDHGALRTIAGDTGALPRGQAAFARLLEPLGYTIGGVYPLPRLKMTGRAFVHQDAADAIPQFFVSELHVDQLPPQAQDACTRVFGRSHDPLDGAAQAALDQLGRDGRLPLELAASLLETLAAAFARQHPAPALSDYETLLAHSKEAAWIATEGNAFNHATTRVPDVEALAAELKAAGYPMKDAVEISANGRVRQTAILADKVSRRFALPDGGSVDREVPGSFYEFISRDIDPVTGKLDLTFDSGNATGIFAVTRGG